MLLCSVTTGGDTTHAGGFESRARAHAQQLFNVHALHGIPFHKVVAMDPRTLAHISITGHPKQPIAKIYIEARPRESFIDTGFLDVDQFGSRGDTTRIGDLIKLAKSGGTDDFYKYAAGSAPPWLRMAQTSFQERPLSFYVSPDIKDPTAMLHAQLDKAFMIRFYPPGQFSGLLRRLVAAVHGTSLTLAETMYARWFRGTTNSVVAPASAKVPWYPWTQPASYGMLLDEKLGQFWLVKFSDKSVKAMKLGWVDDIGPQLYGLWHSTKKEDRKRFYEAHMYLQLLPVLDKTTGLPVWTDCEADSFKTEGVYAPGGWRFSPLSTEASLLATDDATSSTGFITTRLYRASFEFVTENQVRKLRVGVFVERTQVASASYGVLYTSAGHVSPGGPDGYSGTTTAVRAQYASPIGIKYTEDNRSIIHADGDPIYDVTWHSVADPSMIHVSYASDGTRLLAEWGVVAQSYDHQYSYVNQDGSIWHPDLPTPPYSKNTSKWVFKVNGLTVRSGTWEKTTGYSSEIVQWDDPSTLGMIEETVTNVIETPRLTPLAVPWEDIDVVMCVTHGFSSHVQDHVESEVGTPWANDRPLVTFNNTTAEYSRKASELYSQGSFYELEHVNSAIVTSNTYSAWWVRSGFGDPSNVSHGTSSQSTDGVVPPGLSLETGLQAVLNDMQARGGYAYVDIKGGADLRGAYYFQISDKAVYCGGWPEGTDIAIGAQRK